jgi:hypothetical protein
MSEWNTLLAELNEHEPSFALVQEAQQRASWVSSPAAPSRWPARVKRAFGIAFGAVVLAGVLLVLALAAHSRTSVSPAHPGLAKRPPVAPVRLDVRNGSVAVFGNMAGVRRMSATGGAGPYTVHCHGCGSVAGADWSGDGSLLAYSASCAFGGCGLTLPSDGIRVFDPKAGTDRLVVHGEHLGPLSVSADGRWIVYAATHLIRVVPSDGSLRPRTIITSPLDVVTTPTWSPDGRWIAYVRDGRVYTSSADGRNRARLAAGYAAAWSPDGRWIAYVGHGLRLVAPDGTGDHLLSGPALTRSLASNSGQTELAWSPDGKQLALIIGNAVVTVSPRTGAVLRRVTLARSGFWYPTGLVWRPLGPDM